MKRRHFLLGLGAVAVGAGRLGCARLARPSSPSGALSPRASALLAQAWRGVDPARALDSHVHLVGLGAGGTGCYVNEKMRRYVRHPIDYAKFAVYREAAGIEHEEQADAEYVARLLALVRGTEPHGRALLLAFDQAHGEDGKPRPEDSEFYTPNDYLLKVAAQYPDAFVPAASIHPYRPDCVDELARVAAQGARAIKWLPNAQRIDPSSPRCDRFYEKLAAVGLPLITHSGEEAAVDGADAQKLGNPLHLRRALDRGVKVVIAHCASLGQNRDLDAPDTPLVDNFDLFLRLMGEERYRGRLFADVSALPQVNRCGRPLKEVLRREDLHPRLVHGSDYPLPAINALFRTGKLESLGYLTADEREALNELDQHNPLAFDFVLKRCLKADAGGRVCRFPPSVFTLGAELFGVS